MVTKTSYKNKNDVLKYEKLKNECGFTLLDDNTYLVSINVMLPNVTKEMIEWWFWWHAKENKRYALWYPTKHFKISYAKKDKEYFEQNELPVFQNNTHYVLEKVGKITLPIAIHFVSSEEFGFSKELMKENNVETIVAAQVDLLYGLIKNTSMSHIFFKTEEGLHLVSRFWLGNNLKSKNLKKLVITEKLAFEMAKHAIVEYSNLSKKLPSLYNEWLEEKVINSKLEG